MDAQGELQQADIAVTPLQDLQQDAGVWHQYQTQVRGLQHRQRAGLLLEPGVSPRRRPDAVPASASAFQRVTSALYEHSALLLWRDTAACLSTCNEFAFGLAGRFANDVELPRVNDELQQIYSCASGVIDTYYHLSRFLDCPLVTALPQIMQVVSTALAQVLRRIRRLYRVRLDELRDDAPACQPARLTALLAALQQFDRLLAAPPRQLERAFNSRIAPISVSERLRAVALARARHVCHGNKFLRDALHRSASLPDLTCLQPVLQNELELILSLVPLLAPSDVPVFAHSFLDWTPGSPVLAPGSGNDVVAWYTGVFITHLSLQLAPLDILFPLLAPLDRVASDCAVLRASVDDVAMQLPGVLAMLPGLARFDAMRRDRVWSRQFYYLQHHMSVQDRVSFRSAALEALAASRTHAPAHYASVQCIAAWAMLLLSVAQAHMPQLCALRADLLVMWQAMRGQPPVIARCLDVVATKINSSISVAMTEQWHNLRCTDWQCRGTDDVPVLIQSGLDALGAFTIRDDTWCQHITMVLTSFVTGLAGKAKRRLSRDAVRRLLRSLRVLLSWHADLGVADRRASAAAVRAYLVVAAVVADDVDLARDLPQRPSTRAGAGADAGDGNGNGDGDGVRGGGSGDGVDTLDSRLVKQWRRIAQL